MNIVQINDTHCIFNLTGQRVAHMSALALVLETDAIFSRSEAGTVTTYLRGVLAAQGSQPKAIGIRFDKFTDGRSYSIDSRLREIGNAGELHA